MSDAAKPLDNAADESDFSPQTDIEDPAVQMHTGLGKGSAPNGDADANDIAAAEDAV